MKIAVQEIETVSYHSQESILEQLKTLHEQFNEGEIRDKNAYKRKRESLLRQLDNAHLHRLIEGTDNLYLKNYYQQFLK